MKLSHAAVKLEMKLDTDKRKIEGYASVFGITDHTNDIVLKGAFAESVKERMPKMLYQHDSRKVIGKWDEAYEDGKGLYVKGTLAKTALGDEVYELAQMGAIDSMSIGYYAMDFHFNRDNIRELKKVDLFEVSFVTFPANEMATVTNVKQLPKTIREFEEFLRDEGYSRAQAEVIATQGFKALSTDARDAQEEEAKLLLQSLDNAINSITNLKG